MTNMPLDVRAFQLACDQFASKENAELYAKLIEEESYEFRNAVDQNDDLEQLDACMDMIWVILGYCHMKNFKVAEAWDEVAKSNFAKVDKETGKVIRRADGKVLKPEGWKPPDLKEYVR